MGSAVKALRTPQQDPLGRAVGIVFNVAVPQAHDGPAFTLKEGSSPIVVRGIGRMLSAIDFDRQLRFAARQIDDVSTDYELAGEARTKPAQTQP